MKTRMEKYYDENANHTSLRQHKNEGLYENIGSYDIDYKLDNNVTVLDSDVKNIDVEKIKKILDTRYNEKDVKRKSIAPLEKEEEINVSFDETREYDINRILEKARNDKEDDYEKERVKKVRDTQFDILNSLELETPEEVPKAQENELMELINTITARELIPKEEKDLDPLDILTDLKGNDDTMIIGASKSEDESINETSPIMSLEEADSIKPSVMENKTAEFTSTLQFTQSDFDDFNDLKKEVKSNRALIYIIIVIVSLVLIAGLVIFLNKFLNLSLF